MGLKRITLIEKIIQLVSDGYRIEFEPSYNHEAIDIVVQKDGYQSRYSIEWYELDKFYDTENAIMHRQWMQSQSDMEAGLTEDLIWLLAHAAEIDGVRLP